MKKYTFVEFVAALEGEDFDVLEDSWLEWSKKFIEVLPKSHLSFGRHQGDCTRESVVCELCLYEYYLREFKVYSLDEEKFRKEHLW